MQRRECLTGPCGQQAPRLREATAATVALNETLPGGGLEQAQVLARGRLPDSDGPRGRGNRALPLDLDEEAQAGRVPEKGKGCIGHRDGRYRKIRLAQY